MKGKNYNIGSSRVSGSKTFRGSVNDGRFGVYYIQLQ